MSRNDSKKKPIAPIPAPAQGDGHVARSGAGAQTALLAMLKKRQMRAFGDQDTVAPEEDEPKLPGA
jgi:hypothetical protein